MPIPFNLTPPALVNDAILGLNLLTGTLNSDVVGVLDQESFTQIFPEARPMKAFIRETSRVMEHPLESGAMIADHKIIDPRTIELLMVVTAADFAGAFQQIRTAWLEGTLLTVQTKAAVYQNMIIQNLPREEDPEKFDITTIALQMKEVIFALEGGTTSTSSVTYYDPISPLDSSVILRGLQKSIINPASSLLSLIHAAGVWGIS
jgi:hypothetical protein